MDDTSLVIPFDQYVLFKLLSIAQDNTIRVTQGQLATLFNYNPQFQISKLASMFDNVTLKHMYISYADSDDSLGPFTQELLHTDMFSKYPAPFLLMVACYLEITAFNWACANQPVLLNNFSHYDIVRIRHNLNVLASWCGKHTDYLAFINKLRQLDVDLGFLETKYSYVLNHYGYEQ